MNDGYELAVDAFTHEMKIKLRSKEREGYSGWDDCDPWRLFGLLESRVSRGPAQAIDIANYAMMIWFNLRRLETEEEAIEAAEEERRQRRQSEEREAQAWRDREESRLPDDYDALMAHIKELTTKNGMLEAALLKITRERDELRAAAARASQDRRSEEKDIREEMRDAVADARHSERYPDEPYGTY